INARDLCPDTPKDSDIDNDGCPVTEIEYFSFNFDIQFQTASYKLNPEFLPRLKALVLFLQKSPNTLILIEGHTDNIGAESFNLALSKKRAEAIADALISSFNISPERIKTFGYGQERPIASNDTETGRKKNRRVTGEIVTPFHFQQKQEDAQDKNSINPVSHSNNSELIIPFKRNHVG
ncbi:OmpA family protein, partial [Escherichia coli]|uniref:OmpA family protein n=1 Tax=Escherichia coli TaxID=562 RepID=UPI003FA562FF